MLDTYLNLALEAANLAAKEILNERKALKIWTKDDGSPVSSADIKANEILCEILGKSDFKIFSEEQILPFESRKNLEYFWLIDPLDGTSGFLKGSDEFCIMISLINKNRPVLSLIKHPSNDDIFYAHKLTKVYKNDKILDTNLIDFEKSKFNALLSVNHLSKDDESFAKTHNLKAINIGSGLKFCELLQGRAGVYKRFEKLHIWDICAGDFLINQNGGFMGDFSLNLLNYNSENERSNPFIAVSKKEFLSEFMRLS